MGQLFIWSSVRGEWVNCPPDEITWLDRSLLSGNEDLTLHRAPRCAGLRYVHHRWELFSRDATYRVYLAPQAGALRGAGGGARGGIVAGQRRRLGAGAAARRAGAPAHPEDRPAQRQAAAH